MAKTPDYTALGERPIPRPAGGLAQYRGEMPALEAPGQALMRLGAGFENEGDKLFRQFQIEQEKADTTRVEDAWNQYKNAALDLTIGEKGVLKLRGGEAVNANMLQTTNDGLEAVAKRIGDGLQNDEQRARFKTRTQATDLQVKHRVLQHLDSEHKEYAKTVMMGSEVAAEAQVAAAPSNPDVFKQARDTLMMQAEAFLKGQGITDKGVVQAYKDKVNDALWTSRIDALLYSQPLLADALFRANEKEIKSPVVRLVLQGRTREVAMGVTASIEAQKAVDEVRSRVPPAQVGTLEVGSAGSAPSPAEKKLAILLDELHNRAEGRTEASTRELNQEIAKLYKQARPQGGQLIFEGGSVKVSNKVEEALAPNTNGLPNSRDIAAQLPIMMLRVEKRATELYGPDESNPDRAAFVKRMTSEIHSKVAADVQQLNALQRQAQGTMLDAITGTSPSQAGGMTPTGGQSRSGVPGVPITSFAQIQSDPKLLAAWQMMDPQAKLAVERLIEHNQRATDKGDEVLYRSLWNRIHLEPGDPQKIDFYRQIVDPKVADRLSIAQIRELRAEIDRAETPGGRSITQMRKAADAQVGQWFKTNIMFTAQPERQIAATMRWNEEVGKKVDAYVKEGKDVRSLFMLDTKDSVVSQAYLNTFVNSTPAQGLASQAAAAPAAPLPVPQPASIDTREKLDAWFQTLPPGQTTFVGTDGKVRLIPGRVAQPAAAAPSAQAAPAPVQPGAVAGPAPSMNEQGKLVPPAPKVRDKDAVPAFAGNRGLMTPEERALHHEALWYAVKTTPKVLGGAVLEAAAAPLILAGEFVRWLGDLPEKNRTAGAAGAFQWLLQKDSFNAEDVPTIEAALKWGKLGHDDRKKAKAMLKAAGAE